MTDNSGNALLKIEALDVRYESGRSVWGLPRYKNVVHGVSFDVKPGQTFGLVGESGSGKSTIGKAVLRQVPIHAGSIRFDGHEIKDFPSQSAPLWYRKAVQVVFQNPLMSLNPRMLARDTVAEAVRFHTGMTGSALSGKVGDLFNDVGLPRKLGERYPRELSGGQQQRVAIARALASDPRLIVCDEAVSALDVSTQSHVMELLHKLQNERGVSYIFISHDLGVVRNICHEVGVLYQGRFVDVGMTDDVYGNPKHVYTRNLLDAVPKMPNFDRLQMA
ncbi:ABC-type glutathione transport system ATPase component [Neorhizobium galegae]|uniref:ABC transporter ATP-binding protein n=1 Tax=Neorhizobium galegae TaxID=399 RepID=UPI00278A885D|nr:ATP-binding cassette domain-containing protein [Neorhizobium galegae]MDQ0137764.1 ABC-type glutathione transport system ATPase component [Neorhizobium galegae]